MKCNAVRALSGNYLDEELIDEVRAVVEGHLASCPECAADLTTLQTGVRRLKSAVPAEPDPGAWFEERLLDRILRDNADYLTDGVGSSEDNQLSFRLD